MVLFAAASGGCSWLASVGRTRRNAKWDPDKLYSEARLELSNGGWKESRELYQKLESRYPFGRHAQQALMEIAYTYYKEGESAQSIQACDRFIRQYPNHPNVDYMYYLKGLASFNEELGFLGQFLGRIFPSGMPRRRAKRSMRSRTWSRATPTANTRRTRARA